MKQEKSELQKHDQAPSVVSYGSLSLNYEDLDTSLELIIMR